MKEIKECQTVVEEEIEEVVGKEEVEAIEIEKGNRRKRKKMTHGITNSVKI